MKFFLMLAVFLVSLSAFAKNEIDVTNVTIKALPPTSKVTAIYFTIHNNTNKPITLEKINAKFAENFEIHDMKTEKGVMKMTKLNNVLIEEKSSVTFDKHGKHVMVFDPFEPIRAQQKYGIELVFTNGKTVYAEAMGVNP